jgi:serine/threonine protein kinase
MVEKFPLPELVVATDYFSPTNKICRGTFRVVYRGHKLTDFREVAIKRGYTNPKKNRFQETRSAFYHLELKVLSRLHHKHLVRLVGYSEERD